MRERCPIFGILIAFKSMDAFFSSECILVVQMKGSRLEKEHLTIKPGQKFRHRTKGTIWIVKTVKDETILLASENGEAGMRIQKDSLTSAEYEPIDD